MWKRSAQMFRCPACKSCLDLDIFEEDKVELTDNYRELGEDLLIESGLLDNYVESGILLCSACKVWFPVLYGVPVLLMYETPVTLEFMDKFAHLVKKRAAGYQIPKAGIPPGEDFVRTSFSKEWLEYDYDGTIWGWSYEDRKKTFLLEMGDESRYPKGSKFLEIGCGLGLVTSFAQESYEGDAFGMDLSLAVLKATSHFRKNPFLHFVQASLFHLPFAPNYFDLVYSHGVLHHTFSTRDAYKAITGYCRPEGWVYIWVYGRGGQVNTWDRRLGHFAEILLRPFLSRAPTGISTVFLAPVAVGYMLMNSIMRMRNPALQAYNFKRAIHAARDRFTPCFAHRHDYGEVEAWFLEEGFESLQRVDWREVPAAVTELFRGSVGLRGKRINSHNSVRGSD